VSSEKVITGFIGAGGIARAHAFSLSSLRYYYNDAPEIGFEAVSSASEKSRSAFSARYGFKKPLSPEEFFSEKEIDTVYILGPNNVHKDHLHRATEMPAIRRIYIEKPVCATFEEEKLIYDLAREHPRIKIQAGFQFLFNSSVREALKFWKSGKLGVPIHFDIKYFHGDYLKKEYRDKRTSRLMPAPGGGAMADLGSHAISIAIAFLNDNLKIVSAIQAGGFEDVKPSSDLFSQISLYGVQTGAAGNISASRISSGTGDMLSMELYASGGTLKFSSHTPDYFEYYLEETGVWNRIFTGSQYNPVTSFPSGHVPPGWLRAMIHANYVFLRENNSEPVIPDITHALEVQRLVRETSEHLSEFRSDVSELLKFNRK
jgi:predicted dehydrogenase